MAEAQRAGQLDEFVGDELQLLRGVHSDTCSVAGTRMLLEQRSGGIGVPQVGQMTVNARTPD